MTQEQPTYSKELLGFATLYNTITLYLIAQAFRNPELGFPLTFVLFIFWIISLVLLLLLVVAIKLKLCNRINILLLLFSTPLPTIAGFLLAR